jgi:hypothetical protein
LPSVDIYRVGIVDIEFQKSAGRIRPVNKYLVDPDNLRLIRAARYCRGGTEQCRHQESHRNKKKQQLFHFLPPLFSLSLNYSIVPKK